MSTEFLLLLNLFNLLLLCNGTGSQTTKIKRSNPLLLLSRKKRYLTFPKNSNFVINFSGVKNAMQVQPTGINVLVECDIPFPLPSDTRWWKSHRKYRNKREILSQFEAAFSQSGFNGLACVKRIICEANNYFKVGTKSMVKDLLKAVFSYSDLGEYIGGNPQSVCDEDSLFVDCQIPWIQHVIESLKL